MQAPSKDEQIHILFEQNVKLRMEIRRLKGIKGKKRAAKIASRPFVGGSQANKPKRKPFRQTAQIEAEKHFKR